MLVPRRGKWTGAQEPLKKPVFASGPIEKGGCSLILHELAALDLSVRYLTGVPPHTRGQGIAGVPPHTRG